MEQNQVEMTTEDNKNLLEFIRKKEAKRIWHLIFIVILILSAIGLSIWYQITKIGQPQTIFDVAFDGAILPILISALFGIITFCYNKWDKNSEWAELEVLVYSDIIEYFVTILIAFSCLVIASCEETAYQQEVSKEVILQTCSTCNGTGMIASYYGPIACSSCGGMGQIQVAQEYNVSFRSRPTGREYFCKGDHCDGGTCIYQPGNTPNRCKICTDHKDDHYWKYR